MRMILCLIAVCCFTSDLPGAGQPASNLLTNGGFEDGLSGWRSLWCRQSGAGTLQLQKEAARTGQQGVLIAHTGEEDWSFEPATRWAVRPGDFYELQAWVKVTGEGSVTLCASTWDAAGQNLEWSHGERTATAREGWQELRARLIVPAGVAALQPRLIGHGKARITIDDLAGIRLGNIEQVRGSSLPGTLRLTNRFLALSANTTNGTLTVEDHRTGRVWRQYVAAHENVVTGATPVEGGIRLDLLHVSSGLALKAEVRLDDARPEITVTLSGTGAPGNVLHFPHPFSSMSGDRLIIPMNEGISYPVEDETIEPFRLVAYGGHGICMAFWGVTDDRQGYGAIIETPDDAAIRLQREAGRLVVAPEWDPQRGEIGYPRTLRYFFFDSGGHVAVAKRYREYVRQKGLLKTLREKQAGNPNVDLLVGAVNVWNWDMDPVALARELKDSGIDRILWSRGGSGDQLRQLNELKVLTSRYDIYQDMMDPSKFPLLRGVHEDWTTEAWPKDIMLKANGDWERGWGIKATNGQWLACGVLCDRQALPYAQARIPLELATKPYLCRFLDTTTASPWRECFHTNHPMTRTDSRVWKMKLLEYVSKDMKLVTGSETGHDAAVPYVHYFEGMLSLGPYRVPDAGRDMRRILEEVPERVAKFQLGQSYRLPLWELVYHDCVVAQWYWGDYNNKLPALWVKRDLFNVLYGTPPMFMFDRKIWATGKQRFAESYLNTCPSVRRVGYSEMTDHKFLTTDRNVQQTVFANGMVITVNFGSLDFKLASDRVVKALGFRVD